jgi:hypothetical protein
MARREQLERILSALANTAASEADESSCEELQEFLAVYVELKLAGGAVAETYPRIAAHLAVCPSCQEEYDSLLELLQSTHEGPLASELDISRLPTPVTRPAEIQLDLAEDVVRLPAPTPQDAHLRKANQHIRRWMENARQLRAMPAAGMRKGGTIASAPNAAAYQKQVRLIDVDVSLQITPFLDDSEHAGLRARFDPPQPQLRSCIAHLYTVDTSPEPIITHVKDIVVGPLGTIAINDIVPGNYVLTIVPPSGTDEEVALVLLEDQMWKTYES